MVLCRRSISPGGGWEIAQIRMRGFWELVARSVESYVIPLVHDAVRFLSLTFVLLAMAVSSPFSTVFVAFLLIVV